MIVAFLWLACAPSSPTPGERPAASAAVAADPGAALAAKLKARAAEEAADLATRPLAPTRARYGLTLGESDHEAVTAWIAEHALPCNAFPAPTRASFHYRCTGDLPASLLNDRAVGRFSELLVVRAENAPIHYFATTRTYEVPGEAVADYHATLDALGATFGAPTRVARVDDPARLVAGRVVRFAGTWQFRDLDATVSLLHATGATYTVQEAWQVPGVEAQIPTHARTGSLSKGPDKKPPGWNPHVSEAPTLQ